MFRKRIIFFLASFCILCLAGCRQKASVPVSGKEKIRIGLSMDTLKEERWQKDRDFFVEKAEELGAEVLVQSANSDDSLQNAQVENLLSQGIDVLVIIPHNSETTATAVYAAHRANIKVIAYDRIIRNCDLDVYISFDNERVGYLQAEYLVKKKPQGNYVLIGGAPTDNNAKLLRTGQMKALKPYIKSKKIKIVFDQWADDWKPENAQRHIENALTKMNNKVDAIVASNDGTAGGAVQALRDQKLDGIVLVSGQDADLAACERIVEGSQTMTVYKPIRKIACTAAEVAVKICKGEEIKTNAEIDNGKIKVPSLLLTPIQMDKDNIIDTVIKDGFHKLEDVYKNLPKDKWPKP